VFLSMVLEQLDDGASRLLLVLCLPLVDGVFATLLVSGALETFSSVLSVAVTIFSGAGALAVMYSHSDSSEEARSMVRAVAPFLLGGAALVSLVAPVFEQVLVLSTMKQAAGLALLVIASQMAGLRYSDKLSVPAVIVTGAFVSLQDPAALNYSLEYVVPGVGTAVVALATLYGASMLADRSLELSYVRYGGGLVLSLIALSMFGFEVPSELSLGVLAASMLASLR